MGLFDWWGCYCQIIHHSTSPSIPPPSAPSFPCFNPSLPSPPFDAVTLPSLFFLSFSPLDSKCSLSSLPSTFSLSSHQLSLFFFLFFFFTIFFLLSSAVSVSAELRVQDGQWFQDGGVWPREPNGGRDWGEFLHPHTHTHFQPSTLRTCDCYLSGLTRTDWWLPMITDHHLDPRSTHPDSLDNAPNSVSS